MKIFAFAIDDRGLIVFPDKHSAIDYCEAIDIQNGEWLFWDEFGISLEPKFLEPEKKLKLFSKNQEYDLIPFPTGLELIGFLSNVGYIDDRAKAFKDVYDVLRHLTKSAYR